MFGFLSYDQWIAAMAILANPVLRLTALAAALPLGWAGRWIMPAEVPVERLPDLWLSDLGRVAAGLFLTFLAVLCAVAFLAGTISAAIKEFDTWPVGWTVTQMAVAVALMAATLYLAGLALSWIGAICTLLGACGSVWTWARYFTVPGDATATGSVYDSWNQ